MAVSTIAGVECGGVKLTCILYEGAATVTANVAGPDGYEDTGITLASRIYKDQWVELDVQSDNTYAATKGLPVVKTLETASAAAYIGKVVTEPTWSTTPPTTTTATWSADLTRGAYRIATVWFPSFTGVTKLTLVGASAANVVPGTPTTLNIDISATTALAAAGSAETLSGCDAAADGVGIVPLHYVANGAATVSMLVAFNGTAPYLVA